ncbi:MAG: class I SAM-dependent methyltransferase [Candidatus Binatia bacterium]
MPSLKLHEVTRADTEVSEQLTPREISQKYDRFARWYDWVEGIPDLLGLSRLRRQILRHASGKILEVAVGTGKNLAHYPPDSRIIALDLSREMLNVARERAVKLPMKVSFCLADAEALPFANNSFDTVVSSLSTCTFPDPVAALKEIARVCQPQGKVLLLEHGRSDRDWFARWQDRHAEQFAKPLGCHWNRKTLELIEDAGLRVVRARQTFFGIFHQIEAEPGSR